MTYTSFVNRLNKMTDCPVYYRQVPIGTRVPFVCWYVNSSSNMFADNTVYKKQEEIEVDLYTASKDFTREAELEKIFLEAGLCWDKNEIALDEEAANMVAYNIQLIID